MQDIKTRTGYGLSDRKGFLDASALEFDGPLILGTNPLALARVAVAVDHGNVTMLLHSGLSSRKGLAIKVFTVNLTALAVSFNESEGEEFSLCGLNQVFEVLSHSAEAYHY